MTSVLFLTKPNDPNCQVAEDFLRGNFEYVETVHTERAAPFGFEGWAGNYDWIISYLCHSIVPKWVLDKAARGAINFHPAPPEYPGAGSTNIALYNNEKSFGVTCHHMAAKVDSGPIISIVRFPIYDTDTVLSLTKRAHSYLLTMFYDVVDEIIAGAGFMPSGPTWTREPYKLSDFHALRRISAEMSEGEIGRRIRATEYPGGDLPYITLAGREFRLVTNGTG